MQTKIATPEQALIVSLPLMQVSPLYQNNPIPSSLELFKQKFNQVPSKNTIKFNNQTLSGYDLVLGYLITESGDLYKYQMCQNGQPIN